MRDDFPDSVILQATSANGVWKRFAVNVNIAPKLGHISLGASTGSPFAPIQPDATFQVPLTVNAGPQKLGGFTVMIYYETTALTPVSYSTHGVLTKF